MQIGIIGAGPAGCALSCFLAEKDIECVVFDDDKRPDLLVGESLIPAVMPHLRRLGIEQQVAGIAVKKHGAALRHPCGQRVDFRFRRLHRAIPEYSYNIPRPQFDRLLRQRAEKLGVRFVHQRAMLEKDDSPVRDIRLSSASLAAACLTSHPDLLVDATGRHRLFSRILSLPAVKGARNDAAYFAHFENFEVDKVLPGQVVLSIIDAGWSWQIPLQDSLSVGVVVGKSRAGGYGSTPEQRLENIINSDPVLSYDGRHRKKVSKVMTYSNYQLLTRQGFGKGWVLLGDAYGFVDPMLSPGVFMALESAASLTKTVFAKRVNPLSPTAFERYCQHMDSWHKAWQTTIEYFYDGRLLSLYEAGQEAAKNRPKFMFGGFMNCYISRVIAGMVSGSGTRSRYNQLALHYSCKHVLSDHTKVKNYAINHDAVDAVVKEERAICFD